MAESDIYDVIIVGGGPAGLNAALFLGRARRHILLCDDGRPRNAAASAVHGFLTRDGINPRELQRLGRAELERYGVEFHGGTVRGAICLPPPPAHPATSPAPGPAKALRFEIELDNDQRCRSRKLLLTTGVRDVLPSVRGAEEYYGRGVYHCPYCDGWEHRDEHLVAYGRGAPGVGLGLSLLNWSQSVSVCTDGVRLSAQQRHRVRRGGLKLREQPIARLQGSAGAGARLERICFADGSDMECSALFFNTGQFQRSHLPRALGCRIEQGKVRVHRRQNTGIPGLYLAGDAAGEVQFAIVAAGEGATAAVAINRELQEEDRGE